MERPIMVVVYPMRRNCVLLGTQKERPGCRNLNVGIWNGFGGVVENGEDLTIAAARELKQEASLVATHMGRRGVTFITHQDTGIEIELHTFFCHEFTGTPEPGEEIEEVKWFTMAELPELLWLMWPTDRFQLLPMIAGNFMVGQVTYDNAIDRRMVAYQFQSATDRTLPPKGMAIRLYEPP